MKGHQRGDGSARCGPQQSRWLSRNQPANKAPESNMRFCLTPRAATTKVTPGHTENKQGRTQIARQVHRWHSPFCPGFSWHSPLPLICQLSVFSRRGRSRGQFFDSAWCAVTSLLRRERELPWGLFIPSPLQPQVPIKRQGDMGRAPNMSSCNSIVVSVFFRTSCSPTCVCEPYQ